MTSNLGDLLIISQSHSLRFMVSRFSGRVMLSKEKQDSEFVSSSRLKI